MYLYRNILPTEPRLGLGNLMGVRPVGAAHFGDGRSGHPVAHTRGRAPGGVVELRYSGRRLGATRRGVTLRLRPCERRPGQTVAGLFWDSPGRLGGQQDLAADGNSTGFSENLAGCI